MTNLEKAIQSARNQTAMGTKVVPISAKQRALTADEQSQVDAFTKKLTAPILPPAPDGFAHWPTNPHGAADVFSPHHVPSEEV